MKKQEIEVSGVDVQEAINSGLKTLGVTREQVDVEVVLTRRNTFGPLHDCGKDRSGWYG